MNTNPKILLAAPTSIHKDYCFDAWADHIKKITYPVDYLLVDNTPDNGEYTKKLMKHFNSWHMEPFKDEDNYHIVTRSQNMIRNFALANRYDYVFMLESDHFPPVNTIEYLLSKNKLVISLSYFTGASFLSRPLQFITEDFGSFRQSIIPHIDYTFFNWTGKVRRCFNNGIGCMLISTKVLKKIAFRIPENNTIKGHSDVFFHEDLMKNNISNYISEIAFSTHQNRPWSKILTQNK